ncbi:hypothetical protein [Streptomyces noursei]|uniref:hypothetical protein n=1 Tax=Streptomyces noursei TaxID=1971 RepID=UPI00380285D4
MADAPEKNTPIQNKYAQQYADDRAANRKEQGVIAEQIAGLQERLEQLKLEETWLARAQDSLPGAPVPGEPKTEPAAVVAEAAAADKAEQCETSVPAEAVTKAPQTVPQPRQDKSVEADQPAKKAAAAKKTAKKRVARKATSKAPAQTTAAEEKSRPTLWQLVLSILLKTPGQPVVAREVATQLAQDHPSRKTTVQAVRNNLETLVKKNLAVKSHQQGNVMYTAYVVADSEAVAAPAADSEAKQAPEKVPAEV